MEINKLKKLFLGFFKKKRKIILKSLFNILISRLKRAPFLLSIFHFINFFILSVVPLARLLLVVLKSSNEVVAVGFSNLSLSMPHPIHEVAFVFT